MVTEEIMFCFLCAMLISLCLGEESKYEFSFLYKPIQKDYINAKWILLEIDNVNNQIHCASACTRYPECKGFGYDLEKNCFLFITFKTNEYCNDENCLYKEGIKIYMVRFI